MAPAAAPDVRATCLDKLSGLDGDILEYIISMLEGDADNLLLEADIDLDLPVILLQGQQDVDVPEETAFEIARRLRSDDVTIELVKAADHRFSGPEELKRLARAVDTMTEKYRDDRFQG